MDNLDIRAVLIVTNCRRFYQAHIFLKLVKRGNKFVWAYDGCKANLKVYRNFVKRQRAVKKYKLPIIYRKYQHLMGTSQRFKATSGQWISAKAWGPGETVANLRVKDLK